METVSVRGIGFAPKKTPIAERSQVKAAITGDGKATMVTYRPKAKFPWLISQGKGYEVKLTDEQFATICEIFN